MVKILDTTLREGEQTPNVKFTLKQKVAIAKKLDEFGVDYIEAGHPAISENDKKTVIAVADLGLKAGILGHARAKREDIDAVFESGCQWVGIFCRINDFSSKLIKKSKEEIFRMIKESVEYAHQRGLKIRFTVEDATRTPTKDILKIAGLVEKAGANRFSIADTVGCASPEMIFDLISRLKRGISIELEAHCHNDLGLANANALAAYRAGADIIDVTVNGIGERAGFTSLQEFSLAMKRLYGENNRNFELLLELSYLVTNYSGVRPDKLRPVTGGYAFTHTAKLHKSAVKLEPQSYESIDPFLVGRNREFAGIKSTDYSGFIGKPFVRSADELIGHRAGQGTRYVFLDSRVIPITSIYTIIRKVQDVREDEHSHIDMHSHNCDSVFLFVGKEGDLSGLVCEVQLGNQKYKVQSPASVFIPSGLAHSYRFISGSGCYVNIVLSGNYNDSVQSPNHI
ncbi:2-isopropylmalate synthase [Candidatus Woesearchaeota archaeon]|nr:2-isopropylmalate synthase [Candidatus Woesearchaeota archaeon]